MNRDLLYQLYLQELQQQQAEERKGNYRNFRENLSKAQEYGNNLSTIGDMIKNNINNEVAKKLGNTMSNVGGAMQKSANSAANVLDKPTNYFRGFAGKGLQNLGANMATKSGIPGMIGKGLSSLGTAVSGGAAAGTTAGTTAAGTTAGTTTGGAMAGGPIGALIALGIMALQGTNRKRAKKSGEALLKETNELSEQGNSEADQRLDAARQNSAELQQAAQQALDNGIIGAAAPIQDEGYNFPTTKEAFAKSLRDNGWDDYGINSALNGLNLGNKEMSDFINYYNTVAQDGQKIIIPHSENEIELARALASGQSPQSGNVQKLEQVKSGLLDKFINGISDFSKGYEENKNTKFNPDNLREKTFNDNGQQKGKMARAGEFVGTLGRIANKPAGQALLAGGISTALTGNPLYGISMAAKYGGQRAMSDIYQNALAEQGVQVDPGMFGTLTPNDMNSLMRPQYKAIEQQLADELLWERIRHNQEIEAIQQQNANTNQYRAQNGTTIKHVGSGTGTGASQNTKAGGTVKRTGKSSKTVGTKSSTPSGQFVIGETPKGTQVKVPVEKAGEFKKMGGKIVG